MSKMIEIYGQKIQNCAHDNLWLPQRCIAVLVCVWETESRRSAAYSHIPKMMEQHDHVFFFLCNRSLKLIKNKIQILIPITSNSVGNVWPLLLSDDYCGRALIEIGIYNLSLFSVDIARNQLQSKPFSFVFFLLRIVTISRMWLAG